MQVLYRQYIKSTNIIKYTVKFSNLLNLVGIWDPDLVLLLFEESSSISVRSNCSGSNITKSQDFWEVRGKAGVFDKLPTNSAFV